MTANARNSSEPDDSIDIEQRFWGKVDRGDPDECWEWTAGQHSAGYGAIGIDGQMRGAHRVVYALEVEEPGDDWVLHHCDNPPCVNPNHLYLGDQGDNVQDMWDRGGRTGDHQSGEENSNAKLSVEDVTAIRERAESGETHSSIAEDYYVVRQTIGRVVSGDLWADTE